MSSSDVFAAHDELCVHQAFDCQAPLTPDALAVLGGREVSYAELHEKAQRLAATLRAAGVGPDLPVALLAERSIDAVVGIVGVLNVGGAYAPIDPREPDERLRQMLADLSAAVVRAQAALQHRLGAHAANACVLDSALLDHARQDALLPAPDVTPDHLAAAIVYTSRSTGAPKGVAIPHRSIMARVRRRVSAPAPRFPKGAPQRRRARLGSPRAARHGRPGDLRSRLVLRQRPRAAWVDLDIRFRDEGHSFALYATYNDHRYDATGVRAMLEDLTQLISFFTAAVDRRVTEAPCPSLVA